MCALFVICCVVLYGVCLCLLHVCVVCLNVWLDCGVLCGGVWSVVCVGLCVRVGFMCLCDLCV